MRAHWPQRWDWPQHEVGAISGIAWPRKAPKCLEGLGSCSPPPLNPPAHEDPVLPIASVSRCTINKSMLMNLLKDRVLVSPFWIIVQPNRRAFRAIIILAHLY